MEPKTEQSRRTIALASSAVEALQERQARQAWERQTMGSSWQETGFVFTTTNVTRVEPRSLFRRFKETMRKLGLPDMRFHDFGHTVATMEKGVNLNDLQEPLGHCSINATRDIYPHVTPKTRRRAANKKEQLLTSSDGHAGAVERSEG